MVPQSFNSRSEEIVCGFFDADGSFSARVFYSKRKPFGMSMRIVFSQKDPDVLKKVLKTLGFPSNVSINPRTHNLSSGNISTTNSKELAFSNSATQHLLSVWENTPPKAPTKFLDYRICLILDRAQQNEISIIQELLPNETVNLSVACFSLLYLRYQMFGKIKNNKHPGLIPIEKHYDNFNLNNSEIIESERIGKLLLDIVQQDLTNHLNNLSITGNYLLGYHIGDGCFYMRTEFNPQTNKKFSIQFSWKLTDCKDNKPVLNAIKQLLEANGVVFGANCWRDSGTFLDLEVHSQPACNQIVNLFEQWGARTTFPKERLNQFECFSEALKLYLDPNLRNDFVMCTRLIDLKWKMNPGSNYKKKGSYADDITLLTNWFNNKSN